MTTALKTVIANLIATRRPVEERAARMAAFNSSHAGELVNQAMGLDSNAADVWADPEASIDAGLAAQREAAAFYNTAGVKAAFAAEADAYGSVEVANKEADALSWAQYRAVRLARHNIDARRVLIDRGLVTTDGHTLRCGEAYADL